MSIEKIIICLIGSIFQGFSATFVLSKQLKNISKRNRLIFFILCTITSIVSYFFVPNQARFLYSLIVFSVLIYIILKIKDKRAIIYSLNIMIFLSISEIIATLIMVLIGIKSVQIVNHPIYNVIANVLISLVTIGLISIPFINKFVSKINSFFIKDAKKIYYLYSFIAILYVLVSKNGLELILKSNYYINVLFVICVTILIVFIIINEQKQIQLKEINKQAISYIQKYEKIITEQGKANHEFKNQLMVIKGYADMNSPKLKDYLKAVVEDSNKRASTYLISQLNTFPDGGVKGLLYYKLSIMEEKKIKYEIYSSEKVKSAAKKISDDDMICLTKILGVLIDNAIDAASKARDKKIIINLSKERGNLCFDISNTFSGKIEKEKLGTGYTTKGKGHGFGLRLVKDIVKSNDIFSYIPDVTEKYYNVKLKIRTTKKKR